MSGIFGFVNLDGKPAAPELLAVMSRAMAHRGGDREGSWISGPVALGHRAFHSTPESLNETQPLVDESGQFCLVVDGRVDNRDELGKDLLSRGAILRSDTDSELLLRSWQIWEEEFPERIIGDFAMVIWDQRRRALMLARDFLGVRPLYYALDNRRICFASDYHALLADPTIDRSINEPMAAEYLAASIVDKEETLFRSIRRLPPAHTFWILPGGAVRRRRYWGLSSIRDVRHSSDKDYADHFLDLLKTAVKSRMRSCSPVASQLSGGVDSSAIVSVIRLLQKQESARIELDTLSLAFPGLACDESTFREDLASMCDFRAHSRLPFEPDQDFYQGQIRRYLDFPYHPNGAMISPLRMLARERGIRVVLTGLGSDQWFTGSFHHSADLLMQCRLRDWVRQIRSDFQSPLITSVPFPVRTALSMSLWPAIPPSMKRSIRRLLDRNPVPPWIRPEFARKVGLRERLWREPPRESFSSYAQQAIFFQSTSGWDVHALEHEARGAAELGVEERYPFFDRRIVEFGLGVPEEQRWRGDRTKFVLREAMRGLIPDSIRERRTKADFSHLFIKMFQTIRARELLASSDLSALGWLDAKGILFVYDDLMKLYLGQDERYAKFIWKVWMVLGLELWRRRISGIR